jgi:hypothetical protein
MKFEKAIIQNGGLIEDGGTVQNSHHSCGWNLKSDVFLNYSSIQSSINESWRP